MYSKTNLFKYKTFYLNNGSFSNSFLFVSQTNWELNLSNDGFIRSESLFSVMFG